MVPVLNSLLAALPRRSYLRLLPGLVPVELEFGEGISTQAILAKQMPDVEKRRRADFVVDTSQAFDETRAQVRAVLAAVATMPRRRK